jgi:hypothetical protein
MKSLVELILPLITPISVRQEASIDELFRLIDSMLDIVFAKKFTLKK